MGYIIVWFPSEKLQMFIYMQLYMCSNICKFREQYFCQVMSVCKQHEDAACTKGHIWHMHNTENAIKLQNI